MNGDKNGTELLAFWADVASIAEFAGLLIFLGVLLCVLHMIKDIPRSYFRLSALGMEAEMSVGDVSFLIEDQIGAISPDQLGALKQFSPKDGTAPSGIDAETANRLEARGVVRRYRDQQGQISTRLSPLGYRVLKDFAKEVEFSKKIWDWLSEREGEAML